MKIIRKNLHYNSCLEIQISAQTKLIVLIESKKLQKLAEKLIINFKKTYTALSIRFLKTVLAWNFTELHQIRRDRKLINQLISYNFNKYRYRDQGKLRSTKTTALHSIVYAFDSLRNAFRKPRVRIAANNSTSVMNWWYCEISQSYYVGLCITSCNILMATFANFILKIIHSETLLTILLKEI